MTRLAALLLLLSGCALPRSQGTQTTPTSVVRSPTVVVVISLVAPSLRVVGIDQTGDVGGTTRQAAEQETKVDAKADVKVPVIP